MSILLSTRQRFRICDFLSTLAVLLSSVWASVFRRRSPSRRIRHLNDAVWRRCRQLPIDLNAIIEINGISYISNFDKA
jgi:hypothetical protein